MLDYKDILNKHFVLRLSAREISRQTGVSKSGILKFLQAFEKCEDLDYPLPPGITNAGIAMKVYGKVPGEGGRDESYEYPDYQKVLKLMNERKNMTLQVCWDRYSKERRDTSTGNSASFIANGARRITRQLISRRSSLRLWRSTLPERHLI